MEIIKTYIPKKFRSEKLNGSIGGAVSVVQQTSQQSEPTPPSALDHAQLKNVHSILDENLPDNARDIHLSKVAADNLRKLAEGLLLIAKNDTTTNPADDNVFSALRTLFEIANNNEELKKIFLRKDIEDTAKEKITFDKGFISNLLSKFIQGLEIGNFTSGALGGGGAFKMVDGKSELEVDKLTVRMIATFFELVISKLRHVGGQIILTPASLKCTRVVDGGSYYRCYFDTGTNNEVANEFVAGDQARCQVFTGSGAKMYWRLVTSVGTDYINLSKTDQYGDGIPAAGDDIVQLGNRTDITRQNAQILSTVGDDAPSFKQYAGINSFSLQGKELNVLSSKGNKFVGVTQFLAGSTGLENIPAFVDVKNEAGKPVGVRNLLLKSNVEQSLDGYMFAQYAINKKLELGKKYTIVVDAECDDSGSIMVTVNGYQSLITPQISNGRYLRFQTFTFLVPDSAGTHINFYRDKPSRAGGNFKAYWACLYEGDVKPPLTWIEADEDVQERITAERDYVNSIKSDLQSQIDGNISSFFYDYEPNLNNIPASSWSSDAVREIHLGDLFYWTSKGYSYRFQKVGGVFSWARIADTDVTKALADAARAQDTADGKRTTFINQPTPPYQVGDLWAQGASGELMRCVTTRASGAFVAGDWEKASKYTDDTAVENLKIGGRNMLRNSANFKNINHWSSNGGVYAYNNKIYIPSGYYLYQYVDVQQAEQYTLSADMLTWRPTDSSVTLNYYNASNQLISNQIFLLSEFGFLYGAFKKGVKTISLPLDCAKVMILVASANDDIIALNYTQFEKGNKATDYSEAPEDVQDRIAQSKADAEAAAKAYADLKKTEANAYADGKVTAEEQRAIADAQTKYNSAKELADAAQATANAAQTTANEAKAKAVAAEYLKDALKQDTTVQGGLVLASVIGAKDGAGKVRSYQNGNPTLNKTAFAAGVDNFGTVGETKNVDIQHSGAAKIGVFAIGEDGKVRVMDITTPDLVRLLISQENLPTLSSLIDNATDTSNVTITSYTASGAGVNNHLFDEVLNVPKSDSKITLSGKMNLECVPPAPGGGSTTIPGTSCSVEIYKKTASNSYEIYTSGSYAYTENYKEENFNVVIQNVPAGDYKVGIIYSIYPSGSVQITNTSMTYTHDNQVRRVEFGKDGLMAFFNYNGKKNFLHFTEEKGIAIGGETDIPGVLATGSVDRYGMHSNVWGAKAATSQQTITKGNGAGQITGIYNIPHNINRTNYTAIATSASDDVDARIIVKAANYIRVHVKSVVGAFVDAGFDYQITGSNY